MFFIWTGSETQLNEFLLYVNSNNYNLKFTMNYNEHQMNFLDILVYKNANKLGTNLYRKSTDRNSILDGTSFHPIPLKKSLPISQFSRIRRICSSDADFESQSTELVKRFQQRRYKNEWITHACRRFENVTQSESLNNTRPRAVEPTLNCVVQYSPLGSGFQSI